MALAWRGSSPQAWGTQQCRKRSPRHHPVHPHKRGEHGCSRLSKPGGRVFVLPPVHACDFITRIQVETIKGRHAAICQGVTFGRRCIALQPLGYALTGIVCIYEFDHFSCMVGHCKCPVRLEPTRREPELTVICIHVGGSGEKMSYTSPRQPAGLPQASTRQALLRRAYPCLVEGPLGRPVHDA